MKCQILFSRKNNKYIIASAVLAHRVVQWLKYEDKKQTYQIHGIKFA